MKIEILRNQGTKNFTEGKLYVDGKFECFTIEDEDRKLESGGTKIYGQTAIPKGTYNVTISKSNRFKRFLIEILKVDQFEGIRIHAGNSSKDTEGCIIVGSTNNKDDDDWIGASRVAYEILHKKVRTALSNQEKVTLEIV
jgi:hypothetical protein